MCCWSAVVRTGVCTADFGTTLVSFSPREKPSCVILDLSRLLLHRYEHCWLPPPPPLAAAVGHLEKMFLYLGVYQHQKQYYHSFSFSPFLPYLSICRTFCFLVNWYCWCDVNVMNFLLCLWGFLPDLAVFPLCPISSCQPWLSTVQEACPRSPICLCLSYSVNPAFLLGFPQFWTHTQFGINLLVQQPARRKYAFRPHFPGQSHYKNDQNNILYIVDKNITFFYELCMNKHV